jgi:hypothetical protein
MRTLGGLQVKCSACSYEERFQIPLEKPITVHMCPSQPDKPETGKVPVLETVFMEDVATVARTIEAGRAGQFELTFLLKE